MSTTIELESIARKKKVFARVEISSIHVNTGLFFYFFEDAPAEMDAEMVVSPIFSQHVQIKYV